MFMSQPFSSAAPSRTTLRPHRSVGEIIFDAVIEESHEDGLEITEHPVEQGAAISDHAFVKPMRVTVRAGVSDSGGEAAAGQDGRAAEVYERLLELMREREPFDIVTGKRAYKNMLVETLSSATTAETENAAFFDIECREVVIVSAEVTSVPPRRRHANPNKTGGVSDKGVRKPQEDGKDASSLSIFTGRERRREGN